MEQRLWMREIRTFLDENGRVIKMPAKRKKQVIVLWYLFLKVDPNTVYTERELGTLFGRWHLFDDAALIRRELYNFRLLDRERDGSAYWVEKEHRDLPTLLRDLL